MDQLGLLALSARRVLKVCRGSVATRGRLGLLVRLGPRVPLARRVRRVPKVRKVRRGIKACRVRWDQWGRRVPLAPADIRK